MNGLSKTDIVNLSLYTSSIAVTTRYPDHRTSHAAIGALERAGLPELS